MAAKTPDTTLWVKLDAANRSLDQLYADALAPLKLSSVEAYILWALYQQDNQRPSDLARAVSRPATSFTPLLDSLERAGLTARKRNPADRRSITIHLTKQGEQLRGQIAACFRKVETEVHQRLSSNELQTLKALLQKLQQQPATQGK